jgi:hypothetical protein
MGDQPYAMELVNCRLPRLPACPSRDSGPETPRAACRSRAGLRTGEVGEVVAALAVLGLVIDDAVFHFDLAGIEVALEVGGVVLRIPQAELDAGEAGKRGFGCAAIGHRKLPDFQVFIERNKVAGVRLDAAVTRPDHRVAHAVAAGVVLRSCRASAATRATRTPSTRRRAGKYTARRNPAARCCTGSAVLEMSDNPPQPRIAIERVAE